MRPSNLSFVRIVFFSLFIGFTLSAFAQTYPDKTVRLIVPFPPGGATDVVARALSAKLSPNWKQQLIVENKPGAGGNIGADLVAKSSSDGYTILLSSPAEVAINPSLYSRMPYDASKDLIPVSKVASAPLVLVVNSDSPVKNMSDLVQFIKNKKGAVNFASSGTGGPQHLAGELFKSMANVSMAHIPYKGGAPAITDLLGGQVDLFFAGVPPALPHINSGRLRAIAVTTLKRSPLLPNVPTIAERGLNGYEAVLRFYVMGPAKMPQLITTKLQSDFKTVVTDSTVIAELKKLGNDEIGYKSPSEIEALIQDDYRKWGNLITQTKITLDT